MQGETCRLSDTCAHLAAHLLAHLPHWLELGGRGASASITSGKLVIVTITMGEIEKTQMTCVHGTRFDALAEVAEIFIFNQN